MPGREPANQPFFRSAGAEEGLDSWGAAGHTGPDRTRRLLNRIEWDADEVLDDVRGHAVERIGDLNAVLIADDTGFSKKGVRSAHFVDRQRCGRA